MFILLFAFMLQANNCRDLFSGTSVRSHNILLYRISQKKMINELIAKTAETGIKRIEIENPFGKSKRANAFVATYLSQLASKKASIDLWVDRNTYKAEKPLIDFLQAYIPEITFYISRQSHTMKINTYKDLSRETLISHAQRAKLITETSHPYLDMPIIQYLNRVSLNYIRDSGISIQSRNITWQNYIDFISH